ncbi:hypothetical protein BKH35_11265 [Actinomyces naeslundii]|uniref:Uncharacterized protein n=1 Tax=Actinomyces naeslundii TaxID=1655 RepID=A0A854D6B4_ACTNA|nr:hypothetical protein BKH35_11265 [Actinomyces naeslundii]OMG33225.1 hypothetical protein BKH33_11065 [Actinomyces naeslundii]
MLDSIIHLIAGVSILSKTPLRCSPSQYQFFRLPTFIQAKKPPADENRHLSRMKVDTLGTMADPFRQSILCQQAQLTPPLLTEMTISLPPQEFSQQRLNKELDSLLTSTPAQLLYSSPQPHTYVIMHTLPPPIDDSHNNFGHETASTTIHVRTDRSGIKNTQTYRAI